MDNFNGLTPAETERLSLLLEEMGEAQQAIGKILRHGYDNFHPDIPERTNRMDLEKEIGHVELAMSIMYKNRDISMAEVSREAISKHDRIKLYLHHQKRI